MPGDEKMMEQINGFHYELHDEITSLETRGIDFMDWLMNDFTPYIKGRFGLSDDDMYVLSEIWAERYGETTPSYSMIDEFVSVVIDGLRKIASNKEPVGVVDQETIDYVNQYVLSVEDRLNQITTEEEF
jgi:hypothetical protein